MPGKHKLDQIDLRILRALHEDGNLPNARIAERVHLSESACLNRVKRLQQQGVIRGYRVDIDSRKINPDVCSVFVIVTLESDHTKIVLGFENFLAKIPEVVSWHALIGEHDYLLQLLVPRMERHREIMDEMMSRDLHVNRFVSYVAHRSDTKPLDLSTLVSR